MAVRVFFSLFGKKEDEIFCSGSVWFSVVFWSCGRRK